MKLTFLTIVILTIGFTLLAFVGCLLVRRIVSHVASTGRLIIGLYILALVLRLAWILIVKTPPTQDYLQLHKAALAFAAGQPDFSETNRYLHLYPYMMGFVLYQGTVIKLFGTNLLILKLLNVVFSMGTLMMAQTISQRVFSKQASVVVVLFMALYVPNIVINSVLTNDVLATFLFFLAIDLFLIPGLNYWRAIGIGLIMFAANFIRPLALVVLIATLLYGIFIAFKSQSPHWVPWLIALGLIPLTYGVANLTVDRVLMQTGIGTQSIRTVNSYWKFAEGLNTETNGHWSAADNRYVTAGTTAKARQSRAKRLVDERIGARPAALGQLLAHKFSDMWGNLDSTVSWSLKKTGQPKLLLMILCGLQRTMYVAICALALITLLKVKLSDAAYLLVIILIGYVLVHEGIEIQTRYRYFLMPIFMILAGPALTDVACAPLKVKSVNGAFLGQ